MLFEEKHYRKKISNELSIKLRRNTTIHDRMTVAQVCKISPSTVRDVVFQTNNLTPENAEAIIMLAKIAFRCAIKTEDIAAEDKDYFIDELEQTEEEILATLEQMELEPINE